MSSKEILENLIHDFNFDNLEAFFRSKSRTFRVIKERIITDKDNFTDGKKFGELTTNDTNPHELVVYCFKVNKPLTERSGKKAQYDLAKKILKQEIRYSAGIFIFYDDKLDFRFSLIYDIPLSATKRDWSNFRRFTYFVSKDQTNKTFLKQIGDGDFSTLENIKEAFSVEKVTKQFYEEIANWYFWAMDKVEFPDDVEKDKEQRNAKNLIRLITRLIFIWFMKEKNLIPKTLFDKSFVDKILNYKDKTGSTYYKAILQNLFFATLNTPMKKDDPKSRIFVEEAEKLGYRSDAFLEQGYYRYSRFIKAKELFLKQFENIPFLNGGLFESLDKGKDLRVDCFSDNPKNETRLKVPDELFFLNEEIQVDLSNYLENGRNKRVTGLLGILNKYNFTIDENTPIDQDVALDPELLGKVFENLLASYNPETSTTARKATGSYYTPREIVDYMVDESLIEYCNRIVFDSDSDTTENNIFFNPFSETEIYYGKQGKLPHMLQPNVWYFVTFRLADSLPQEKIKQLEEERTKWLNDHKGDFNGLPDEDKKEYYKLFSERVEQWLNDGYGSCILKEEKVAQIVANALMFFSGKRYELGDWVIMPNHVHLLIRPYPDFKLSDVMHSIKSFSAHEINKLLGKKGDVWMHESYDHIVRNESSFYAIKNYIRQNPVKAKISLPNVCCSWKVSTPDEQDGSRSQEAFGTMRSQEASATLIRQLFDYNSDENPFKDQPEITLKLIDAIEKVKILDPACGSGAFPMGILHKLVLALHKLDPENKLWKERVLSRVPTEIRAETEKSLENKSIDYIRKLGLIENCIYGVDIQEIAIQISKLRFFISLLVEQEIDDSKPNRDIRALPNLETKFVAANTLISLEKPSQFSLKSDEIDELETALFKVREEIFYTNSRKEKLALQRKEKELREKLKVALKQNGFPNDTAEKITSWDPFDQNTHANWFDPEWMFGVKVNQSSPIDKNKIGFDIVIGNPPYIQLQKAFNNKIKYADLYKNQNYETFERTGDIYCLFYEKGIKLLSDNGLLCYITSNKWMRAGYGESLRKFFLKFNPKILIDLGPNVFENATVDTNILLIGKEQNKNELTAVTINETKKDGVDLNLILSEKAVTLNKLTKDAWFIGSDAEQRLKEKIERIGKPLKDWDVKIYRGVLTGLNEAFIIDTDKRNEILANCKVTESSRFDGLTELERTEAIIKPILRGRDIKRYYYEWAGLWVIVIPAGWTNENRGKENPKKFIEETFPALMEYLKPFESKAKKRDDQGDYWWELRHCAYYPEFEKEKVVWQELAQGAQFSIDLTGQFFVSNTAYILTGKRLKYILGYLNSRINEFTYEKWYCTKLGEKGTRWLNQHVIEIPLPSITSANQPIVNQIEGLVDKIIETKRQDKNADTSQWEREIDRLVYELYDLTEDEIKIIEGVR